MFWNISNHPCNTQKTTWSAEQIEAAKVLGGTNNWCFQDVIDCGFPAITPEMDDLAVREACQALVKSLMIDYMCAVGDYVAPPVAMVAGHYLATMYIVAELQGHGVPCYVGDSVRIAEEVPQPDGTIAIVHKFKFAGFRKYPEISIK